MTESVEPLPSPIAHPLRLTHAQTLGEERDIQKHSSLRVGGDWDDAALYPHSSESSCIESSDDQSPPAPVVQKSKKSMAGAAVDESRVKRDADRLAQVESARISVARETAKSIAVLMRSLFRDLGNSLPLCTTLLEEVNEVEHSELLKHLLDACKRADLLAAAAMPDLKKNVGDSDDADTDREVQGRNGLGIRNARLRQRRSNANVGWADEDLKMRAAGTRRLLRFPRVILCRYPSSSDPANWPREQEFSSSVLLSQGTELPFAYAQEIRMKRPLDHVEVTRCV